MSVRVMSEVFDRYPSGGGEFTLALALADHAHDDGSHIFPSIKKLAEKTRQSERTVQYQLRKMEQFGWLILINSGNGGRNQTREYQISSDWLKGADFAPMKKGAIDDVKGCNPQHKRVQLTTERVQPIAPAYNHQEPSIEPSGNHKENSAEKFSALSELISLGVEEQTAKDWLQVRKEKKAAATKTAIDGIAREAGKAKIGLQDALSICCERGWQGFKAEWIEKNNKGAIKHGNFSKQDYSSGIGDDGSF
jgi:hypothetical protein